MSKVHGYIEIDPTIILAACDAYILERKKKREARKSAFIKQEMGKRFFPAKTEEEAEKRAWDCYGFCKYALGGGYWADLVISIGQQAETAIAQGSKIFISDDVHSCIYEFLPPKESKPHDK